MKKIIVASKNPTKIQSTLKGFQEMFPNEVFEIEGIKLPSNVNDQPIGNEETFTGAINRAKGAQQKIVDADYWVGIEGGNIAENGEMEVMAWIIILSKEQMGKARTAGFYLPPKIVALVNEGHELGHADDIVFGVANSKQTNGSSGLLTNNVMTRIRFYTPAVILALIPFQNKDLFPI